MDKIGIIILIGTVLSFFWVKGIDHMKKNHPNYKGEDFLDWEESEKNKGDN